MEQDLINFKEVYEWILQYKQTDDPELKYKLKNMIVIAALPLVKKIAHGLARRSSDPVEDIIQVGSVGLIKAIQLFDPAVSRNFKTYATYLITGEIKHYLRDKASMIKAPRAIQELAIRVYQLTAEMTEALGNSPSESQLAEKLNISVDKVQEVIDVDRRKNAISLDQIINESSDNGQSLNDKIADDNYKLSQELQENRILLKRALNKLDDEDRDIIEMSYFRDMSQREIAEMLDLSQMQISRKIKKALHELYLIITKENND